MIFSQRLYIFLTKFGVGSGAAFSITYLFYPFVQEKRLLKLLQKLDDEGKIDEMKEVVKSPYLQRFKFEFTSDEIQENSEK